MKHEVKASSLRAAGLISAFIFLSRLLGVVREQVFAALLGAGMYADAFVLAFRVPNLLRDLFAEGALSAAFVPTYARALAEGGREEAHRLSSRLLTFLAVAVGILVLLGILGAWPIVTRLAPGFDRVEGKAEFTVLLTRIMMPFLAFVSFAAVAMGMLNAEERFALPALAPATFNLVTIAWGVGLYALGLPVRQVAVGWAFGTLLGGAAQVAVQAPGLRRLGFAFRPEWAPRDRGLKRMGALMAPATVGLAAVQINIFVNSIFASYEEGAVACVTYAFRILYLPIGIFGVALGTVATTGLARSAAAGDLVSLRETLQKSIRMVAFLTVPATAGLVVLATPIVRLLYERGAFAHTANATSRTAAALALYALGLVAYTGVKVLAPAFYALGTPRAPLIASGSAVLTNLAINLALFPSLGFKSVPLGTSVGAWVNALILFGLLEYRLGGLARRLWGVLPMLVPAAAMSLGAWGLLSVLPGFVGSHGLKAQAVLGLAPVCAGAAVYGGVSWLLGIPEARLLVEGLLRLLRPRGRPAGA